MMVRRPLAMLLALLFSLLLKNPSNHIEIYRRVTPPAVTVHEKIYLLLPGLQQGRGQRQRDESRSE